MDLFEELKDEYLSAEVNKNTTAKQSRNTLDTPLGSLTGYWQSSLFAALNLPSVSKPPMTVIQLIILTRPDGYSMLRSNCDKDIPKVFSNLSIYNYACNLRWLIKFLYESGELLPLKSILSKAPPMIKTLSPNSKFIKSGKTIIFQVSTVFPADITWMMNNIYGVHTLKCPIELPDTSIQQVNYTTMEHDDGKIYIIVRSQGDVIKSEEIYVTNPESAKYLRINEAIHEATTGVINRVALLFGFMDYGGNIKKLKAPKLDIANLDQVLRKIGFKVFCFLDLNERTMKHTLDVFAKEFAKENSYVFFYCAGHGFIKNRKDFVRLLGHPSEIDIAEITKRIAVNKPKPVVAFFDICRTISTSEEDVKDITLPFSDRMILVMSTFPHEKAYEVQNAYDSHSTIIKALCNCLDRNACSEDIDCALVRFASDPSIDKQKPTVHSVAMPYIFGNKDLPGPKFMVKCRWLEKSLPLDAQFDTFHNVILISIREDNQYYIEANKSKKTTRINLFQQVFDSNNSFQYKVFESDEHGDEVIWTPCPFKIILPADIVKFFNC